MQKQKKAVQKSKRKKLIPIPTLKRRLWVLFSTFIRLRDADNTGWCNCCTCGKPVFWTGTSGANAGHFFTKRGNPMLLFEENDCHSQHRMCNKFQKNNITWDYFLFMEKKYGRKEINRLASLRGKEFKFTREWLENKIEHYKTEVERLKEEKNL